ncbi:MAG: hypothetical protein R3F35_17675 [Myxococcota bacterium]
MTRIGVPLGADFGRGSPAAVPIGLGLDGGIRGLFLAVAVADRLVVLASHREVEALEPLRA